MTALKEYLRLEAIATLRNDEFPEGAEVIIALGEATLAVMDFQENGLAQWSLAAIERTNPGEMPATFRPDGCSDETIEIGADEALFVDALTKINRHIEKKRKKPFKARRVAVPAILAAGLTILGISAPTWIREYASEVVPDNYKPRIIQQLQDRNPGSQEVTEYTEETLYRLLEKEALSVSLFLIVEGKVPAK